MNAYTQRPGGWFHSALVYYNNNQGYSVYHNGQWVGNNTSGSVTTFTPGDGRMVIGRFFVNQDRDYSSVEVDELTLWNRPLTVQEVEMLAMI